MPKIKLPKNAAQMKAEMAVKRAKTPSVEARQPTQYELAHKLAQERAALPIDQGGLGLPPDNTAMDRAKALGFDTKGFHATGSDIKEIDPNMIAKSDYGTIGQGFYIDPSENASYSNLIARINKDKSPQNIMPLMFKSNDLYDMTGMIGPRSAEQSKQVTSNVKDAGYKGTFTTLPDGSVNEVAVFDPTIVRSSFAAFDPFEIESPDLLKAKGGKVQKMAVGGSPFSGGSLYQDEEREREFRETPSYDAMSMSGHIPAFSVYNKPTYASSIPGALPSANQQRREYTEEGMIEAENRERVKNRDYLSTIDPAGTLGVADVFSTLGKGMLSVPAQIAGNVADYFRSGKVTPESEKRREEAIGEWAAPKTQEGAEFLGEIMTIPEKLTGSSMGAGSHPFLWVHGIGTPSPAQMKAGLRLASEKAAPVARNIDTRVRQAYESGMIPQPGMSIKDVGTFTGEKPMPRVDELGFYSPAEAAALNIQRKSGVGQAFISDLKKAGVTDDEMNSIGLNDWLADKKTVSADEVRNYINENRIQLKENRYGAGKTQYDEYSIPGGENYREVTLSLPEKPKKETWSWFDPEIQVSRSGYSTQQEAYDARPNLSSVVARRETDDSPQPYYSSHWQEPNVVAHLRMKDFKDAEGKKTLLVEEVQSDWHQRGRDNGYVKKLDPEKLTVKSLDTDNPNDVGVYDQDGKEVWVGSASGDKQQIISQAMREINADKVPDAPFKDTWYQMALRRAIKEAVDNGYDRVALPTGMKAADRLKMLTNINDVWYSGSTLRAYDKDGDVTISTTGVRPEDLPTYIGKDAARKLMSQPDYLTAKTLSDQDIQLGGEGMVEYYDKIYPAYLKKFAKKYNSTVGETTVNAGGRKEKVRYMDITPEMRESIQKGVPYKKGGAVDKPSKMRHNSQNLTAKQPSLDVMRLALQKRG